ncbi:MAG: D-glycero-beta-D-manno-heptose-7-phosphate kinase [Chitinophagaceae bacterium]|nr:D-glycero-beta-D-manno-heptose-7-phosphate kinase [Chitinophagaceae bacterium]
MPHTKFDLDIQNIIKKFIGSKIIVVGDVMLDVYLRGSVNRISPEAPVPVVSIEEKDERLGGAANVALNLKSLGATPLLCSVIGNDVASKSVRRILKKNGMAGAGLLSSSKRITSVKTRVLSRNHQMLRYDAEDTTDLNTIDEQWLIKKISEMIMVEKPAALIFEDYNKGVLTEKLISNIIALCRKKKVFTAVDPKKKNFFTYKNIDLFKPNLREIRDAFNKEITEINSASLLNVSDELMQRLGNKITLITLSEMGIFFHSKKDAGIFSAHKRHISDVSGAGDTVIALITLCLVSGLSLPEAATLANMAGGLVCEHPGVVPISTDMLLSELKNN